jgi:peptidoglycan/LPS O-acetylase OafA/YrhL
MLVAFVLVSAVAVALIAFLCAPYITIGWGSRARFLLGFFRLAYPFSAGILLSRLSIPEWRLPLGLILLSLSVLLLVPINSPIYEVFLDLIGFPAVIIIGSSAVIGPCWEAFSQFFGHLSYPLYLLHWPIFAFLAKLAMNSWPIEWRWGMAITATLLSVAISFLAVTVFDEPVRIMLKRVLSSRNAEPFPVR